MCERSAYREDKTFKSTAYCGKLTEATNSAENRVFSDSYLIRAVNVFETIGGQLSGLAESSFSVDRPFTWLTVLSRTINDSVSF